MNESTIDRRVRADAVFREMLELEPGERSAALDDRCGSDAELRRQVEELLRLADDPSTFLDQDGEHVREIRAAALDVPFEKNPIGERVGPYRIVSEIARGGMGIVYLAERDDGQFDQRLVVKLIRRGLATDEILLRFARERQILATLAHPNIARLLDGGVTDDGLPYFAMEYVDGEPIDQYCNNRRLSIQERLGLVIEVGRAVQYAHRNLVVHRDLKPTNIFVTTEGRIRLLDFGIARLLTEDQAGLTQTDTGPMTPEYASPEQLSGEVVTTASDVYQLGLVLYELLTGERPERDDRLVETGPSKASAVAADAPDAEILAAERAITPKSLVRELRGDLDTILATALRPQPERRYATAEQFVEDLERTLGGRPISARADSVIYRMRRFVGRHQLAVVAAIAFAGILISYAVTVTRQARALQRERDLVRIEAATTNQVRDFLVGLFETADPSSPQAQTLTAQELLERGARRIDDELADEPEIRGELLDVIGKLYEKLGLYDLAAERLEQAIDVRRTIHGPRSKEVATSLLRLGDVRREQGEYDAAELLIRDSLRIRRQVFDDDTVPIAQALRQLGLLDAERGEYDRAEPTLREALEIYRTNVGEVNRDYLTTLANLALSLKWKGDFDAAGPLLHRCTELARRIYGGRHLDLAWAIERQGVFEGQRGDFEAAEPLLHEALRMATDLLGEDHPDVALMTNNLGKLYSVSDRPADAEPFLRRALEINRRLFGERHRRVATNLANLGVIVDDLGRNEEASTLLEESVATRRSLLGPTHPDTILGIHYLARSRLRAGHPGQAWALYRQAIEPARSNWESGHPFRADVLAGAGEAALGAGRPREAVDLLTEALDARRRILPPDHPDATQAARLLARARVLVADHPPGPP